MQSLQQEEHQEESQPHLLRGIGVLLFNLDLRELRPFRKIQGHFVLGVKMFPD